MKLHHRVFVAAGLAVPSACAPTAHRGHAPDQSAVSTPPEAAAAGPGAAEEPSPSAPGPVTTSAEPVVPASGSAGATVTIAAPPAAPATTRRATTTTVTVAPFVVPEREDEGLTDAEWWASQPGFVPGACGGSLPPCWVMRRESGGDPTAVNATGCGGRGCFGKWQFDPRTSQGLGYAKTMDQYPESVQDEAARALWAGGQGCSHWGAC